jgi:hypothetical protein
MNKKKMFTSGIHFGQGPDIYAMRELAKSEPVEFIRKIEGLVEGGHITLSKLRNLTALYGALADVQVPVTMPIAGTMRTVMASAFPILTGTTVVKAINDSYAAVPTIGELLVQELDDNKKITTVAAIHTLDNNVEEVKEKDDFPEIGTDEESVQIRERRNGRRLTITAEMIERNELPDIVSRVDALGEIAAEHIEELTLKRVTDYHGSKATPAEPYAYRPEGTGTALYSASANTPGTRAPLGTRIDSNALVDYTDIDAFRIRQASMKNARGTRIMIPWSEVIILVPYALIGPALKVFSSEYTPGVENEYNPYGPRGKFFLPPERILTSTKMDDLSSGAWYGGAFRRQFRRKWALRMEYVTLGTDTESYLRSRIAFQARIAWNCEVGAVDYVYVIQNLAAATAPADE